MTLVAEFCLQDNPQCSPRLCYFCGCFDPPFVNTMTFDPAGRTILLCAPNPRRESGCAGMIANLIGGLTAAAARDVRLERDEAVAETDALRLRLERIREDIRETVAVD